MGYARVSTKLQQGGYCGSLVSMIGETISLIKDYDEENGCFEFDTAPHGMIDT